MSVLALATLAVMAQTTPAADGPLQRLAEEAEVFAQSLDKIIGEETIRQKSMRRQPRFKIRVGDKAFEPEPPSYQERELRSEFGYASIKPDEDQPGAWHEVRQVLEVDGKAVQNQEKARRKLVEGLRSGDEEVKKKLLEDLEHKGLSGSATDFSLCLLLFRARNLSNFTFTPGEKMHIGADEVQPYRFTQKQGPESFTVVHGKKMIHQVLEGEMWLRTEDGLPVKIKLQSTIPQKDRDPVIDIGEVEYTRSQHGILLPVAVTHRRTAGEFLLSENEFIYSNFKKFSSDSEIKFTPVDETPEGNSLAPRPPKQ